MNVRTIATVALAALLLFAGAAAATPGNGADGTTTGADAGDGDAGPPSTLPGPVPDFVGDILDNINRFVNGDLDGSLGDVIRGIAGNGAGDASP